MLKSLSLLLLLFSFDVLACFPVKIPLPQRTAEAQAIFVGYVTGRHHHQFEQLLQNNRLDQMVVPEPYLLRIAVQQTLKGKTGNPIIYAEIRNCGSGKASIKDKVMLFKTGEHWFTLKFSEAALNKVKQALANSP